MHLLVANLSVLLNYPLGLMLWFATLKRRVADVKSGSTLRQHRLPFGRPRD